jgi:hypothetical protein
MMHEFHRRLPALVFEQHHAIGAILSQIKTDPRTDPFVRPGDHLPQHTFAGLKFKDLHVEAAQYAAVGAK